MDLFSFILGKTSMHVFINDGMSAHSFKCSTTFGTESQILDNLNNAQI